MVDVLELRISILAFGEEGLNNSFVKKKKPNESIIILLKSSKVHLVHRLFVSILLLGS